MRAEAMLFMASRAELVDKVVRPSLEAGTVVISDRFLLANVVYQGHAGGLDADEIWRIGQFATAGLERLTQSIVLDLPVDAAQSPARPDGRSDGSARSGLSRARSRGLSSRSPRAARENSYRRRLGSPLDALQSHLRAWLAGLLRRRGFRILSEHDAMSWKHSPRSRSGCEGVRVRLETWAIGARLFVCRSGGRWQACTFARELAKTILCEARGDRFDACDECASCKLVDAGTHPDLFMVRRPDDSLEFPIDVIREELLPNLAMKAARGARKIAILDDADDLNDQAANCFLKTLEEPPPGSLLILVGGRNAERQLPTILSRCQVIRFTPLPPAQVLQIMAANGITDPTNQQRLLQLSGGCPGQALGLDDAEVWEFRGKLLGTLRDEHIDAAAVAKEWMEFIDNAGKDAAAHRNRASLILRLLIVFPGNGFEAFARARRWPGSIRKRSKPFENSAIVSGKRSF
jgi:hypothetical protein